MRSASTGVSERAAGLVLAMFLAGCSGGERCVRQLIAVDGGAPGFAALPEPWVGVGARQRRVVFAPLSTCASDSLSVKARLRNPGNLEVPVDVIDGPSVGGDFRGAHATVEFTPTEPGPWFLEVTFEPSLGMRSVQLEAVASGLVLPFTRVFAACQDPRAIADDTVLCEQPDGGISVHRADGGTQVFPGSALVVAEDVAWSVDGERLQRRQYRDGGLELTHEWPDFDAVPTPSLHSPTLALRYKRDGYLGLVHLTDSGVVERTMNSPRLPVAYFLTLEAEGSLRQWMLSSEPPLWAVEPQLAWFQTGPASLSSFTRPLLSGSRLAFASLDNVYGGPPGLPQSGVDRIPLWLDPSPDGRLAVLVERDGESLRRTAWPWRDVRHVAEKHVVVWEEDWRWVRVYRK